MSPDQLALHTFTTKPWNFRDCVENYANRGIKGISVWRETIAGIDLAEARRQLDDSGLTPISLVRGGFFTGKDEPTRSRSIDENLRTLDEAAALGLPMVVLVCGATPGQDPACNLNQISDGIATILPEAEARGIRLAIEPLHPMYAADRSAVATMRDANDLADRLDHPLVGVAVDVFHVWWDATLDAELTRCAQAGRLFAFHACEFKPDFDHPLLDRGLPGEGVNATPRIHRMVRDAGFTGLTEIEIFSRHYWSMDQHQFLDQIIASCAGIHDSSKNKHPL